MSLTSTSVTAQQRSLLDAVVRQVPAELDSIFETLAVKEPERGACTTFSRILAEVLGEFGIKAEVRPVYIETANRVALAYLAGEISQEEAIRRGAKIQMWGDIAQGQAYQHAVCYLPAQDVVIDLAMEPRLSRLVPSYPYWAEGREFPWWVAKFEFKTYPLEYRAYETHPGKVRKAKSFIREVVRRYYR